MNHEKDKFVSTSTVFSLYLSSGDIRYGDKGLHFKFSKCKRSWRLHYSCR